MRYSEFQGRMLLSGIRSTTLRSQAMCSSFVRIKGHDEGKALWAYLETIAPDLLDPESAPVLIPADASQEVA